ncbi:hypothetical protein F4604DRAFT_425139 [Suillus subluteus]|nr:hypothetical protein F4604DRAFT_425139 [Suillus subluteus]
MLSQVSKSSPCACIILICLTMMAVTCCLSSRCHLHHITMSISTASRLYYRISNTHHNQPCLLPLHRHPPHPLYLKLRFCPIEPRVRWPRVISKLVHGLCVVNLRITPQHNDRTTKNMHIPVESYLLMLSFVANHAFKTQD